MCKRVAIHATVTVVFSLSSGANHTLNASPFRRPTRSSSAHPFRANAAATHRSACASADSHRLQIPLARAAHDQRLVASAEQVTEDLVPAIEP
jgi:hypothetical protein